MLGAGSHHVTASVPTSGHAARDAPPAAQPAGVIAAAARAAADRHGEVSAPGTCSAAERAASATAAAAATATAGFQPALRGTLPRGAALPVAAGAGDVASAFPPPAPNGHLPTAPRPVVRGASVGGRGGAATECDLAALSEVLPTA